MTGEQPRPYCWCHGWLLWRCAYQAQLMWQIQTEADGSGAWGGYALESLFFQQSKKRMFWSHMLKISPQGEHISCLFFENIVLPRVSNGPPLSLTTVAVGTHIWHDACDEAQWIGLPTGTCRNRPGSFRYCPPACVMRLSQLCLCSRFADFLSELLLKPTTIGFGTWFEQAIWGVIILGNEPVHTIFRGGSAKSSREGGGGGLGRNSSRGA